LGVDVSAEAVESARLAFGDHFALAGSAVILSEAPYDVIYHVGMIGCVADPIGLTSQLLAMLKPGGKLLFNAPNRQACTFRGQLWIDSAPPPDVVTLFPPGFWKQRFSDTADVVEETEMCSSEKSLAIGLRKMFGGHWRKPAPVSFTAYNEASSASVKTTGSAWHYFERAMLKALRVSGLSCLAPREPFEFGLLLYTLSSPEPGL
jgi:SAM-dependent methyltransferase